MTDLFAIDACYGCGRAFDFDPDDVPSVHVDPATDLPPDVGGTSPAETVRRPLCPTCAETVRRARLAAGLRDPWPRLGPLT